MVKEDEKSHWPRPSAHDATVCSHVAVTHPEVAPYENVLRLNFLSDTKLGAVTFRCRGASDRSLKSVTKL